MCVLRFYEEALRVQNVFFTEGKILKNDQDSGVHSWIILDAEKLLANAIETLGAE